MNGGRIRAVVCDADEFEYQPGVHNLNMVPQWDGCFELPLVFGCYGNNNPGIFSYSVLRPGASMGAANILVDARKQVRLDFAERGPFVLTVVIYKNPALQDGIGFGNTLKDLYTMPRPVPVTLTGKVPLVVESVYVFNVTAV